MKLKPANQPRNKTSKNNTIFNLGDFMIICHPKLKLQLPTVGTGDPKEPCKKQSQTPLVWRVQQFFRVNTITKQTSLFVKNEVRSQSQPPQLPFFSSHGFASLKASRQRLGGGMRRKRTQSTDLGFVNFFEADVGVIKVLVINALNQQLSKTIVKKQKHVYMFDKVWQYLYRTCCWDI